MMTFTDWSINAAGMPGSAGPVGPGNVSNSGTPTIGQVPIWTDANHIQGVSPTVIGGGGGRLQLVNATTLQYKPYMGNGIVVNGQLYAIPASGIVGLGTTGVFVGGIAGQNLVLNTGYNVYVFNNGGVPTADFVLASVGHSPSATPGNIGTEIKTGDDTRSLIGLVQADGNTNFRDEAAARYTRSWFHCQATTVLIENQSWGPSNAGSYVSIANVYITTWAGEVLRITSNINYYINDTTMTIWFRNLVDGVAIGNEALRSEYDVGHWLPISIDAAAVFATDGPHYVQTGFHQDGTANRVSGGASIYATAMGIR